MAFMISFFGTFYENLNTMLVVVTVKLQDGFFYWASPENVSTGPPLLWKSSKYGGWERGDSEYFNIFNTYGGPVWDSNVFLKSVTYWPTLSKFRGGAS